MATGFAQRFLISVVMLSFSTCAPTQYYFAKDVRIIGLAYPKQKRGKGKTIPLVDEQCDVTVGPLKPVVTERLKDLANQIDDPIFYGVHVERQMRGIVLIVANTCDLIQAKGHRS